MTSLESTVHLLHLFGDPTRVRLIALLTRHSLTVAELTTILGLAQSRVSTHLGKLREAGVLRDRKVGASTFYSFNDGTMPAEARKMWSLLEDETRDTVLEADRARGDALVNARDNVSGWSDAIAGQMERYYSPGRTWEATARGFLGLMRVGDVLDIGSGDGTLAQLLAPRVHTITCLDRSEKVIDAARNRLGHHTNAHFLVGDMHELPFDTQSFDQALLFNVLTHSSDPPRALREAGRVLRSGGLLSLVTLDAHHHEEITSAYHHIQMGFRPAALRKMLHKAGFEVELCEVTSREHRPPHFQVITVFAHKPSRAHKKKNLKNPKEACSHGLFERTRHTRHPTLRAHLASRRRHGDHDSAARARRE